MPNKIIIIAGEHISQSKTGLNKKLFYFILEEKKGKIRLITCCLNELSVFSP
jgi:hypothetical protein